MASLSMLTAVFLFATLSVGNKAALADLAVSEVGLARIAVGATFFWLIMLATRQRGILDAHYRRRLPMGLLDPGLVAVGMVWALSHTAAVNVAVFWSAMPLVMPMPGRDFPGELLRMRDIAGALVAFAGTVVLVWHQFEIGAGSPLGDLIAAGAVLCARANQLIARGPAQTAGRPLVTTTPRMSVAVVIALVVLVALGRPAAPHGDVAYSQRALLGYLGIATASPFFFHDFALARPPVARASLFSALSAPLVAALAVIFLGEIPTGTKILAIAIAIAIVLGGIPLATTAGGASRAMPSRYVRG